MRLIRLRAAAAVFAAVALFAGGGGAAQAGFLTSFSGNVQMTNNVTPQSVVSYAVFQGSGSGNIFTQLNTALGLSGSSALSPSTLPGGGSIDTSAKYVYMYQVVNYGGAFDHLYVGNASLYTSAGYFSNTVFRDAGGAVGNRTGNGTAGNPFVISDRGLGTDSTNGNNVTGVVLGPNSGDANVTSLTNAMHNPSGADLDGSGDGFLSFDFGARFGVGTTSIVVLTSNWAPQWGKGVVTDGGSASGFVPTAVTPEPGTLVLSGLGLVGLLGFSRLRRRALALAPAA